MPPPSAEAPTITETPTETVAAPSEETTQPSPPTPEQLAESEAELTSLPSEEQKAPEEPAPIKRSGLDALLEEDEPEAIPEQKPEDAPATASEQEEEKEETPPPVDRVQQALANIDLTDEPATPSEPTPPLPMEEPAAPAPSAAPISQPASTDVVEEAMTDLSDTDEEDGDLPPPPWEAATQSFGSTLPPSVESLMASDKEEVAVSEPVTEPPKPAPVAPPPIPSAPEDLPQEEMPQVATDETEPEEAPTSTDPNDDWDIADLIDFKPKDGTEPRPLDEPELPTAAPSPSASPSAQKPPSNKDATRPPWAGGGGSATVSYDPPPELPGDNAQSPSKPSTAAVALQGDGQLMRNIMVLGLAGLVVFGAYLLFFRNSEKTTERLARWTGTLNEVSQDIPTENASGLQPEETVRLSDLESMPQPLENDSDTQIDFVDDTTTPSAMGDDKQQSLFASLQDAIVKAREAKGQEQSAKLSEEGEQLDPTSLTREERVERNDRIREELEAELQAYRQALTNTPNPALRPGPSEFFNREDRTASPLPTLPEDAATGEQRVDAALAPNPQNLPIIAPPQMPKDEAELGVRSLRDFDVSMFEPPRARVRMPPGVKPSVTPVSFPKMLVLSLVPNRGVIAQTTKKEGVLLIGESIEGWELVAVHENYAEFRTGRRKHILTLDN